VRGAAALPLLLCASCGLLLTTALPSLGWWPLVFVLAPLFVVVARAGRGRAAVAAGFAFGVPFFAVYVLWLPRSFGQLFGPAFWFVFPAMVALLALFWGLTCWGAWWLAGGRRGTPPGARVLLLLPALWVLVEWARTQGYFAFPWGTLGYAWLDTPVAQLAEFIGVYGLSLLATAGAALLAWPFAALGPATFGARLGNLGLTGLALVALVGFGFWRGAQLAPASAEAGQQRALLVQGNVDPFARAASAAQELDIHLELTAGAAADGPFDLVVWPEGAVLGYQLAASDAAPLRQVISSTAPGADFIVGGRTYEGVLGDSYNSLFSLWDGALLGRYDKEYLVPFGERWPLIGPLEGLYRTVFGLFGLPLLASSLPGTGSHTLPTKVGPVAAFICYESVFPQVQRAMVAQGAQVLVLATNDAWFGLGNGAQQHFDMGRLRAIETRRWLLRSGNDGITAAVDPYGRVTQQLPRHVAAALPVTFQLLDGATFWVRYGQLTPAVLAAWTALFWLILSLTGQGRDQASGSEPSMITLTDA
jgi:apolipoprotein N-acyltransferase